MYYIINKKGMKYTLFENSFFRLLNNGWENRVIQTKTVLI